MTVISVWHLVGRWRKLQRLRGLVLRRQTALPYFMKWETSSQEDGLIDESWMMVGTPLPPFLPFFKTRSQSKVSLLQSKCPPTELYPCCWAMGTLMWCLYCKLREPTVKLLGDEALSGAISSQLCCLHQGGVGGAPQPFLNPLSLAASTLTQPLSHWRPMGENSAVLDILRFQP